MSSRIVLFFFALESTHTLLHSLVLTEKHNISKAGFPRRISYFSSDLLSSLCSFFLIANHASTFHAVFVAIHCLIHIGVVMYIVSPESNLPWKDFMRNVFRMARKEKSDNEIHALVYRFFTCQDIVTHAMNAYCLYSYAM